MIRFSSTEASSGISKNRKDEVELGSATGTVALASVSPANPSILWGLLLLASLTIFNGCMVGPDYHPPQFPTPPTWSGPTNITTNADTQLTVNPADLTRWWTKFQDPKLTELVTAALHTNLDVRYARSLLLEARAIRGRDAGGLWPTANADASATHTGFVNGAHIPTPNLLQAGVNATWNLDFFGVTRRQLEADNASIDAATENVYGAQVTLVSEVALDYIQVRNAQELIAIALTNLDSERHTADVTRRKGQAGFVSGLDQANADAEVATTAASIPPLETTIQQNIFALSILLDKPPAALLADLSQPGSVPPAPPEVPIGLPSDLLRRRPDVRAAEANLHAAAAQIGVAVADFYPQFSLTGQLNYSSSLARDLFAGGNGLYSVGPAVTWPIFSGGSMVNNLRLQKASTDASYLTYQKTVLAALADVESYLVAFAKEWDHRQALNEAVIKNRRALELSQRLYQAGTEEFLTVLDAERSLFASETALAQSRQAISSDLVNIYRALGGGWEVTP